MSLQNQYQNFTVRLMQSKSPFRRRRLVCFQSNTLFLKMYNNLSYSLHTQKIWKRSVGKYKSYGTLSKTTHFLSVSCQAGVAQQCTEAPASMVQDGLSTTHGAGMMAKHILRRPWHGCVTLDLVHMSDTQTIQWAS